MDYKELKDFIKSIAKSGISEVDIKTDKMSLSIKVPQKGAGVTHTETIIQQVPVATPFATGTMQVASPVQQTPQAVVESAVKEESTKDDESGYITIKAPIVGTFYKKPAPDKPNYVNVGDTVNNDSVVCIIEAMKLFNEIEAEVSGKIIKILVEEASPVEFDQPLFLVDPS